MTRTRIGVDIGSTAVRAAEVSLRSNPPELLRVAQIPMPAGAVANGEVRDVRAVAGALRELWRRGKFRGRDVVLGVGNQRVVVREVVLPWLAEKELRASLGFQVQEFVPIPVEDAVLDYQIVEEFEHEGRRMIRLLLVAAQKAMIMQIVEAAEMAKLRPVGLDLIPFAIVRSVGSVDALFADVDDLGDEAVIEVGAEITSICIHSGGLPRFVRILPAGGRDITSAVARALGIDEDEAERLKRGDVDVSDNGMGEEAARLAIGRASNFADEIRSSLDFYLSQVPDARIGRVLLTGGGAKLSGFDSLLEERLPHDVVVGRPFHRVNPRLDLPDEVINEAEPLLAVAIGLALPGDEA